VTTRTKPGTCMTAVHVIKHHR